MRGRLLAPVVGLGMVVPLLGVGAVGSASVGAAQKRADLVVSAVAVSPARVKPGGRLNVRDVTKNRGRKVAGPSVTRMVLSKNKVLDKRDIVLRNRPVPRLRPGKQHAVKMRKVRVPARTKPGAYWLLACADAKRRVRESNERNNCRVAKRMRVAKRATGWPSTGAVRVRLDVGVDVAYWRQSQTIGTGFKTVEERDARLDGKGVGWLMLKGGEPDKLVWTWSSAKASGTVMHDAQGQTTSDCRWDAYTKFSRSGTIDVTPGGLSTGAHVVFPASDDETYASFGLEKELGSKETPRIDCKGENIGNVSPVPTVRLETYWWAKDPTYTMTWSRDFSRITWRQFGEQHYVSSSGASTEDQTYQADGVVRLTRIR